MLILIGNCPSSGSTLLSDILDSTPESLSGPELGMFSNKNFYLFAKDKSKVLLPSRGSIIHPGGRNHLFMNALASYGLNMKSLKQMIENASELDDFYNTFALRYSILRGRKEDSIVFEKTPSNLCCLGEYLKASENSNFVHISRNPLYIYSSLLKRGKSPFFALCTWFSYIAKYYKYKDNSRVHTIKYENLVESPFQIVSDLIKTVSQRTVDPFKIEELYKNNKYRPINEVRVQTWGVKEIGTIESANKKIIKDSHKKELSSFINAKINPEFAERFDLAPITFIDALKELGYHQSFMKVVSPYYESQLYFPYKTFKDNKTILKRWVADIWRGEGHLKDRNAYFSPIIFQ